MFHHCQPLVHDIALRTESKMSSCFLWLICHALPKYHAVTLRRLCHAWHHSYKCAFSCKSYGPLRHVSREFKAYKATSIACSKPAMIAAWHVLLCHWKVVYKYFSHLRYWACMILRSTDGPLTCLHISTYFICAIWMAYKIMAVSVSSHTAKISQLEGISLWDKEANGIPAPLCPSKDVTLPTSTLKLTSRTATFCPKDCTTPHLSVLCSQMRIAYLVLHANLRNAISLSYSVAFIFSLLRHNAHVMKFGDDSGATTTRWRLCETCYIMAKAWKLKREFIESGHLSLDQAELIILSIQE